jgi:predicted nucleic acid-binding protein
MLIIADAGPLLSFARAHFLDLLHDVLGELIVPEAVYDEIVVQGTGKPGAEEIREAFWIKRERVRDTAFVEQLPRKLHRGEREALALAKERNGILLVDEHEARREAHRLSITYIGSLRILKEAKDHRIINKIKPILDAFIASGTYLNETLYQEFLREVGEGAE